MRYLSTRAAGPASATHSFEDVLLAGLAEDGGLFVPETLPKLDAAALRGLAGLPYAELAARILALFVGDAFSAAELRRLNEDAYPGFGPSAGARRARLDVRPWAWELVHL